VNIANKENIEMTTNDKTAPALARYAEKEISTVLKNFTSWLEDQTGYPVDPQTVSLAIDLHSTWQRGPENQKRIAEAKARREADTAARAERKAAREAKAAEPKVVPAKVAPARGAAAKAGK
jgi:hypothetical protein